jgi:hypothetical protein
MSELLGQGYILSSIYIKMDVFVYVCVFMFQHNSGTPRAISTKLGTHIAICMCKNLMDVLYIYIYPKHHFPKGIWMIHVVEEIKLLLLLSNRMVMTSRLATIGQTYPRKHIRGYVRYLATWNIKQFTNVFVHELLLGYEMSILSLRVFRATDNK